MIKKISLALFLGLMACSDDSGTSVNRVEPVTAESSSGIVESSSSMDPVSSSNTVSSGSVEPSSSVSSPESSAAEATSSAFLAESSSSEKETGFINEGWREDCLAKINEYRATENLKPLALAAEEKQTCADKQSADDLKTNKAHGHFGDCGEFAQNSGPNFSASWQKNASAVAEYYLKMMWEDEKAKAQEGITEYAQIGHYLNMKNTSYTKVACGISLSSDGKTGWFNVDFF